MTLRFKYKSIQILGCCTLVTNLSGSVNFFMSIMDATVMKMLWNGYGMIMLPCCSSSIWWLWFTRYVSCSYVWRHLYGHIKGKKLKAHIVEEDIVVEYPEVKYVVVEYIVVEYSAGGHVGCP